MRLTLMSLVIGALVAAAAPAARGASPSGLLASPSAQSRKAASKPAPTLPQRPAERKVPFRTGETLGYDISWSSYLTAGTATVAVKEKRTSRGSMAYYIVAEARPTPLLSKLYSLYYKVDTLLDAYSLLPQRGSIYSEEGKRRRTKITTFNGRSAEFEFITSSASKQQLALPPYAQDALSAIYVLRAIPFQQGGKITMPVVDSGRVYSVTVSVVGKEIVTTGVGTVSAWKIVPVITGGKGGTSQRAMAIWIGDDARRLPVKLTVELAVGSFDITLREVAGS